MFRPEPSLIAQRSSTSSLLQAVSVVNESVVWVSGHDGTYSKTIDGGNTWRTAVVPNADTLQFRDVHAFDADRAYLLSAGPGEMSRIYRTNDGGRTWDLQFLNADPDGFYDCLDFWDTDHGIAYGDAIDGQLKILRTTDGGENWTFVEGLPPAAGSEGGFAASGTCAITVGNARGYITTGAGDRARVLITNDRGATWRAVETPVVQGAGASGLTSAAFFDLRVGMIFGGDLSVTDEFLENVAVTADGGDTWDLVSSPTFPGSIYGSSIVPGSMGVVVAGPRGLSFSQDLGETWMPLDTLNYWAVGFASPRAGWAVGPGGRISKVRLVARAPGELR